MKSLSPCPRSTADPRSVSRRSANGSPTFLLGGQVEDEADVLEHQARREGGGVILVQQRLGLVIDEARADDGGADDLEQLRAVDAGGLAEDEGLPEQLGRPGDQDLEHELHDACLLLLADVEDGRPDRAEQWSRFRASSSAPDTMIVSVPPRTTVGLPLTGARR